jgi:sulfatase modifying factor 1
MRSLLTIFSFSCFLSGVLGCLSATSQAGIVTFGAGGNQFAMEFVTIGNRDNAADTTGIPNPAGAVAYEYGIGKFEVSREMITKYNAASENEFLQITLADMTAYGANGLNKPATGVTWAAATRFVNWLNTSTGGLPAYNFFTGGVNDIPVIWTPADTNDYDAANPYRSKRAKYALPSYNEWYKAAYHSPSGTYYDFPNGSNNAPTAIASGTGTDVNGNNTAVYGGQTGPADVDKAGGLSPYGVMGLGGNVWEWEETAYYDLTNSTHFLSDRGIRGGDWSSNASDLSSSTRSGANANAYFYAHIGFRVVSLSSSASPPAVPEPSTMFIGTIFGLGGLMAKRRMKK